MKDALHGVFTTGTNFSVTAYPRNEQHQDKITVKNNSADIITTILTKNKRLFDCDNRGIERHQ